MVGHDLQDIVLGSRGRCRIRLVLNRRRLLVAVGKGDGSAQEGQSGGEIGQSEHCCCRRGVVEFLGGQERRRLLSNEGKVDEKT